MFLKASSLVGLRLSKRAICSAVESVSNLNTNLPESFRTLETDPAKHTLDHEGKFYTVDKETHKSLFHLGGFSKHFRDQLKILDEVCIMVRRPALEMIHYLKTADYSLPPIRYVLHSKNLGAGMTMSLAHTIHYAWLNQFVIVHCSIPFSWIRTSWAKTQTPSAFKPPRVDQNREAGVWLQHFKNQNERHLDEIKLSQSYTWSKREVSEKGEPLRNVVEHGLSRLPHATDCVAVLLKEIKAQSGPNSFRTLVVVDGVNALYGDSQHKRPDGSRIATDEFTLIRAFKKLLTNDWSNAAVVTSADVFAISKLPERPVKPDKVLWPDRNPYVYTMMDPMKPLVRNHLCHPKELLGPTGFSILDPFVPVEVVKYNLKEFYSCYDYYLSRNYITSDEGRSEEGREELRFLSGLIPTDLMRYCASV